MTSYLYAPIATDDSKAAGAAGSNGSINSHMAMNTGLSMHLRIRNGGGVRSPRDWCTALMAVKQQIFMFLCYIVVIAILFSLRAPEAQLPVWEFQFRPTRISNSFQFEWLSLGYVVPMMIYDLYCIGYGVEYKWLIKAETNYMRWAAYALSFPFQIAQLCFVSGMTEINGMLAMSALALCHVLLYCLYDYEVIQGSETAYLKAVHSQTTREDMDENEKKEIAVVTHQKNAKLFIAVLSIIPWLIMWYILFRNGAHLREEGIVHEEWIIFSVIVVMVLSCFQVFNLLLFRDPVHANGIDTKTNSCLTRCIEDSDEQQHVGNTIIRRKLIRERVFQFLCFASQVIQSFIIFGGTKENSIVLGGLKTQPFKNLGCFFE